MGRIRNIKPEFFSHEELQDMEVEHPELHPMLVFSALWTQCEWSGVFSWSIRKLKIAVLPFLNYDLEKALEYLKEHGFIGKFSRDGKNYGFVYSFTRYQAISGKERNGLLKYPIPTKDDFPDINTKENYSWSISELDGNRSGTGQELDGNRSGTGQELDGNRSGTGRELDGNRSGTGLELDRNWTGTGLELDGNKVGSPDIDIDIDIDKDINLPPKNDPPKPAKKIDLLDREPKNDLERVNKKWLENYISLFEAEPINPAWSISSPLVSKALKQAGIEKVLQALDTAKKDKFCLESGYILKIIMSGSVISRLVNTKSTGPPCSPIAEKKSLGGLDSWQRKKEPDQY